MDRLIESFIKEPEREFHVRELSKLLKKSPTTISKYLKMYGKESLLNSKKKLGHLIFKANTENIKFRQLKLDYNLRTLYSSGLIDCLTEEFNHPEAIVLFGSFAKADNIPSSDIDLLIISPLKKEIDLKKYEKILGHKIQLFVCSNNDIEKIKVKNKELINNWINGKVLYGFLEVFK